MLRVVPRNICKFSLQRTHEASCSVLFLVAIWMFSKCHKYIWDTSSTNVSSYYLAASRFNQHWWMCGQICATSYILQRHHSEQSPGINLHRYVASQLSWLQQRPCIQRQSSTHCDDVSGVVAGQYVKCSDQIKDIRNRIRKNLNNLKQKNKT